jgi:hypothetical protein
MIIYQPTNPDALEKTHIAVSTALSALQSSLLRSGFRIFDARSLGHIVDGITQRGAAIEEWVKIADQNQINILVTFEMIAGQKKPFPSSAFAAAKTSLHIRSFDTSTGRLVASVGTTQKQMTNARMGSFDWNNALSKAGERAANVSAEEITRDIIKYYETVGEIGNAFLLVFKDFTEDEEFQILKILENLEGYQSLAELENIPLRLRVEYFSSMNKSRIRRKLYLACKSKGIRLQTKELAGNRLIFVKP